MDLTFTSNWWNGGRERYVRFPEYRTTWTDNLDLNGVPLDQWPAEAQQVMTEAGSRRSAG